VWESGGSRVQRDWVANAGPGVRARTVDSEGGLEWIRVSFCVRDCRRKCSHLSHGHPLSECRVSCEPRWAHGQDEYDTRSLAAFHLGSGLGQSWKVNRTAWAVRLDVGVSASRVDSQRDGTAWEHDDVCRDVVG